MKKFRKITAVFLCAAFVFALLSSAAFAADDYAWQWSGESSDVVYDETTGILTITGDGTLTLTADAAVTVYVTGGTVTIDTAGYTLTQGAAAQSTSAPYGSTIYIEYGATVTITGSGTVQNTNSGSGSAVVFNEGTCTIENGTYYGANTDNNSWYTIVNHGTMTINGGTFKDLASSSKSSLIENGYVDTADGEDSLSSYVESSNSSAPTLTINGGTFTSTGGNAIKNDWRGVLVVNDGTFSGYIMNWSEAILNGGTYSQTVYSMSTYWTSTSLEMSSTLTINGGTYNGAVYACPCGIDYTYQAYSGTTSATITINIYDGIFNGYVYIYPNSTTEEGSVINIYGGTYNSVVGVYYGGWKFDGTITSAPVIYHGEFTSSTMTAERISAFLAEDEETTSLIVENEDGSMTVHCLEYIAAADATCTEDGNTEYYYCSYDDCNTYFIASEDEDGNTVYTEADYETEILIAATGHSYDSGTVTKQATATEDGVITYTCTICGDTYTEEIPATGEEETDGEEEQEETVAETEEETESETGSPETDDSNNVAFWSVFGIIAALSLGITVFRSKFSRI